MAMLYFLYLYELSDDFQFLTLHFEIISDLKKGTENTTGF